MRGDVRYPAAHPRHAGDHAHARYVSQEYDALFERYLSTIPRTERTQLLGQIVHHMTDRLVTLGIFYTVEPSLVSSRLANVAERKGESSRQPWNVHEWDVP